MRILDVIKEDIDPRNDTWVGPNIGKIQQGLKDLGFDPGSIDSNFGPNTANAVRKFQAANPPLKVDGDPGPDTVAAMNKLLSNKSPSPAKELPKLSSPKKDYDSPEWQDKFKKRFDSSKNRPKPGGSAMIPKTSYHVSPVPTDKVTQPFGGTHNGVDIRVPLNTEVKSPISGKVTWAGYEPRGGYGISITNGNEEHYLGHLASSPKFKTGDTVNAGDIVGSSGASGNATGPHLHWRKTVAGNPVDPLKG
jgi:murein DD-endopeptidase MepM/ murein hydrolase activator NlpD